MVINMENRCLRIAILMLAILSIQVLGISAQYYCTLGDFDVALVRNCKECVQKGTPQTQPSQACCDTLKAVDIPCLCKNLPPNIEDIVSMETYVSMEKFIYVATTCGCQIPPPGDKCGSYTIPGPPPRHVVPSLQPLKT